jgi:choline monooxygenase
MSTVAFERKRVVEQLERPAAEALALPAVTYTDPAFLTLEHQKLFEKGWVGVMAAQQLKKAGDVHPITVAGRPLLVLRDRDDRIRVFHRFREHLGRCPTL